jgi:ribose-phosphate pyrophosphokinase
VTELLLAFDDEASLAARLAAAVDCPLAIVDRHRFPDGETRLRLPAKLPDRVIVLRGLQDPNAKLTELLLAAGGAREWGAKALVLVSPYLAYMRQDMAFVPGEVVSQRVFGRLLADHFDGVITVDPHLHRTATMAEALPGTRGVALSAAVLLGAHAAKQVPDALLVAPDEEAGPWVREAALAHGLDHAICVKRRRGDLDVAVEVPAIDVAGRAVVLLDDVASTGRTLAAAARGVLARGAASVDVAVTHGLFIGDALAVLSASGIRHVWSSDSVPHASNTVSVVPQLAAAVKGWVWPHR